MSIRQRAHNVSARLARIIAPRERNRIPVDPGLLCTPIETAGGSAVSDFESMSHWIAITHGATDASADGRKPIYLDELLAEEHHHVYGKPWVAGRIWFDFLLAQGLRPCDRVLDFGCGSGRIGVHLISFLDTGGYHGIDGHLRSLVAFSAYEIRVNALASKRPRLLLDSEFRFEHFGTQFDVVLDLNVTNHLPLEEFRRAFTSLRRVLAPDGRVFVRESLSRPGTVREREVRTRERINTLDALGYTVAASLDVAWPLPGTGGYPTRDQWYILRAA